MIEMHRFLDLLVFRRGMGLALLHRSGALADLFLRSVPMFQRTAFGTSLFFIVAPGESGYFRFFVEMPPDC